MNKLSKYDRLQALREAGHTKRMHTMPTVGDAYTVANHSYQALTILMSLHASPSPRLIRAMLWHDSAERFIGDLPATVKLHEPELKATYERIELRLLDWMGCPLDLTPEEMRWLRGCDAAEFLLWTEDQINLGNRFANGPRNKILEILEGLDIPPILGKWLSSRAVGGRLHETLPWLETTTEFVEEQIDE